MASFSKNPYLQTSGPRDPGKEAHEPEEMSALQKHVGFFDRNNDGIVYPWETFKGFRAIGAGLLLSSVSALFINGGLSYKTLPGKIPSPLLPIYIKNIHKGKHPSDSGVYDKEGRFVESKFEEIFRKYALTHPDALTYDELGAMLKGNREPNDTAGWIAAQTEWKTLYNLCKDERGLLPKETIRSVYDGGLFHRMEKQRASKVKK
ncbi:hypothetical protein AMTRI_Chr04g188300 [Amborella trichopoda]